MGVDKHEAAKGGQAIHEVGRMAPEGRKEASELPWGSLSFAEEQQQHQQTKLLETRRRTCLSPFGNTGQVEVSIRSTAASMWE